MKTISHSPEALESRIAPARFFLSHAAFDVVDKNGASVNDTAAASLVGADLAVMLKAGDSVVLDANSNHRLDAGETVFAQVAGGRAVLFAKAHDANNAVDADEITGLIVSDSFRGALDGDLYGSITTGLTSAKTFDPTKLLDASIAGLTVTGLVSGDVLAGRNLSKINIGTGFDGTGPARFSVEDLRAGTAANNQTISYNGGGTTFTPVLEARADGAAGGSISRVTLALGAKVIAAGDGNAHPAGRGGAGGSITGLKITHFSELGTVGASSDMQILAGHGADGGGASGRGGAGGLVRGLRLTSDYTGAGQIPITAGDGGSGHFGGTGGTLGDLHFDYLDASHLAVVGKAGKGGIGNMVTTMAAPERVVATGENNVGGAGGSVSGVTVKAVATHGRAEFWAGDGGAVQGTGDGRGGAGGNVSKFTLTSLGGDEAPYLRGGRGASSVSNAPGGAGGSVSTVKIKTGDIIGNSNGGLYIYGGDSGWSDAGPGGAAGAVKNMNITMGSLGQGEIYIYGGDGGRAGGRGGGGGSVSNVVLKTGALPNSCYIGGGNGGNANYYSGDPAGKVGGTGGSIRNIKVDLDDIGGGTEFGGGDGGPGNAGAVSGKGGGVQNLTMNLHGTTPDDINIVGGRGGSGANGSSGGAGGDLRTVRVNKLGGNADDVTIHAGMGGTVFLGPNASGGSAGDLFDIKITTAVPLARLEIGGHADGASAGVNGTLGGDGSSLTKISVKGPAVFTTGVFLNATKGGDAPGSGGRGGASGDISSVMLDVPGSLVRINADPTTTTAKGGAGGIGAAAVGGDGGSVSGISGKVGTLIVQALAGGNSGDLGGNGGDVTKIELKQTTSFVRELRAGDGGSGTTSGRGGSISGVSTPGDIGDFAVAFDADPRAATGMGGLFVGQSPTPTLNGSVTGISATRIAAILAGSPAANSLGAEHAVTKIAKIKATAIGSDLAPGGFDFTDHDGDMVFQLGDGDTALDGLVIVRTGGGVFPVPPLKLIEV